MMYTRKDYENFLLKEFDVQTKEFEQLIKTKALLLKERGAVFVGKFLKLQENGIAIFKVRNSDNMPRKNSFWTASYLTGEMSSYKNWGNLSWAELRHSYQKEYSDAHCVWISKSDSPEFCLIGIKNLSVDFAELLNVDNPIIAFGPNDPPLQYLLNLIDIVKDNNESIKSILDFEEKNNQWNPTPIGHSVNFSTELQTQLNTSDCIVIQGPPGTGKTYRMAQLAEQLMTEKKSVLVTALTNQALIELAKKEHLKEFLKRGNISKTSLTIDESRDLPNLLNIKDNKCNSAKGHLTLATFYIASGWACETNEQPYDYVIMDEASQALLPMIAASLKLGRKVIWIGDQSQLSPIVITNEDVIAGNNWTSIVRGFEAICANFDFKSYILSDTFRLTERGAESTGIFYNNCLKSSAEYQTIPSNIEFLNKKGGPIFIGMNLPIGDKAPLNAFEQIFTITKQILDENSKAEIAILSKFRETIRQLQKHFTIKWHTQQLPDNLKIETVDRVQGLTVDYCIFLIPNTSIRYSLEKELFNVATSRAKYNTMIVSDNGIIKNNMSEEVRKYLLKAQEDKFASFEPQTISSGNIKIKVVGKIDLSQFSKRKTGIIEGKENIYIIDTNVFIDCPDIITRIGTKYKTIIPAKVLEELDKKKLCDHIDKQKINEAAKNISKAFVQKFSHMEEADVSLLPSGFDNRNPDCMILSVALKYKHENPIILTSDNIMITRAIGLGITAVSLKDFLRK